MTAAKRYALYDDGFGVFPWPAGADSRPGWTFLTYFDTPEELLSTPSSIDPRDVEDVRRYLQRIPS